MSEQEGFWQGTFGDEYTRRNRPDPKVRANFWELILEQTAARSVLEVGCNWGCNLLALRDVAPTIKLRGVDVNDAALAEARAQFLDVRNVPARSVGQWRREFDLVATCGVLIHIPPEQLVDVMVAITTASREWVLAVEYAHAIEREVQYRGHARRLWKRPFGELYQEIGLDLISEGDVAAGDGFDNCKFWLLRKPADEARAPDPSGSTVLRQADPRPAKAAGERDRPRALGAVLADVLTRA